MKIPASAFPQMLKMVTSSLPYEVPFEPETGEAKAVIGIGTEIIRMDPNLTEIYGFIYHLAKNIDDNTAKQISTSVFLLRFVEILSEYAKEQTHEIE